MLIGHAGHEEVVGTTGQAPGRTILVQDVGQARSVQVDDPANLSYLTQTTLSVDETNEIVEVLRERFPSIQGPPREDICYATQNRQDAVKEVARRSDVVLVIGSDNSSNSKRLAEVARDLGTPAHLVDDETEVDPAWLEGATVVGLTSGRLRPRTAGRARARLAGGAGRDRGRRAPAHRGAPALLRRAHLRPPPLRRVGARESERDRRSLWGRGGGDPAQSVEFLRALLRTDRDDSVAGAELNGPRGR